jgi:vacuolar protein sorting-associated protein 13D
MSKLLIHDYLLCPVSAEARIAKNNASHPLSTTSQPRFDVQLSLDSVPLQMTDSQYRNSFRAYKSFLRLIRNCRLRHYRPFITTVKERPLEWWGYAVRAILAVRGYKRRKVLRTWEEVLVRAKENIAYVAAYEQHLLRELVSSEVQKIKGNC